MINQIKKVEDFHKSFKSPIGDKPQLLTEERSQLRAKLILEETQEYLEACEKNDLVGIADALGDQLYILCGTIVEHGLQDYMVSVFNEIHKSNMSKLGPDGQPIFREDGKILKGASYKAPKIKNVLKRVGKRITKKSDESLKETL